MTSSPPAHDIGIDWQQIHARLARAAAMTQQAQAPSPQHAAILLDQRARRLAQPSAAPRGASGMLDLMLFSLSSERYGIETRHVREVRCLSGLTPVPGTPALVAGIANLRGQVLVVFDLRHLFGLALQGTTEASRIVVCGDAQAALGLLVDTTSEVMCLPDDDVRVDPIAAAGRATSFIRGVTRDATIIIDGAALLSDRRLFIDDRQDQ